MVYGDGIYGAGIYGLAGTISPTLPRPTHLLYPNMTVQLDGDDYPVAADTHITIDAGAVPYAEATVDLPLLDEAVLDLLDPRTGDVRCPVTGSDTLTGAPREFDLGLREREIDHAAKTITLRLAGDEALLMDYAPLTDDPTPRTFETSLRGVCDYVLDKIGAALETGSQDADLTAYWKITNVVPNPSGGVNADNWMAGTGASALQGTTMAAPLPPQGNRAVRWTTAAGDSNAIPAPSTTAYGVTPGRSYVFSAHVCTTGTGRDAEAVIQWWGSDGTVLMQQSFGDTLTTSSGAFQQLHVIAEAPAGAQYAFPYIHTSGNSAGQFHFASLAMFYEGDELVSAFTGGTSDDAHYAYTWARDAHSSPSTRTPDIDRPPELFIWKAGQTGWEFLSVLCASAGMTLWCDEQRRWFLQTPESRTIPTLIAVTASTSSEGTDVLSREDTDTYVTGVVCRYFWTDRDGAARTQTDAAGTPGKVLVREFDNTPYPGPGVAAAMLARRAGTGRAQTVTAITRWDATPGMTAQITLPSAPETVARVSAVTFHPDGFMELKHAGLVDLIPGSIAALTGTIDSLAGTIDGL